MTIQNVLSERGLKAFFRADILTCHSRESTGVTNNINNGCIPFRCASSRVLILCTLTHCQWPTGTLQWNRAIINVISSSWASPAMTSQNICCEKKRACLQCPLISGSIFFILCWCVFIVTVDKWPKTETTKKSPVTCNIKGQIQVSAPRITSFCLGSPCYMLLLLYRWKPVVEDAEIPITPPTVASIDCSAAEMYVVFWARGHASDVSLNQTFSLWHHFIKK